MNDSWQCDIFVQKASGFNLVSAEEFFAIAVTDRIELILNHKVRFVSGDGTVIPPREALAEFKRIRGNGTS